MAYVVSKAIDIIGKIAHACNEVHSTTVQGSRCYAVPFQLAQPISVESAINEYASILMHVPIGIASDLSTTTQSATHNHQPACCCRNELTGSHMQPQKSCVLVASNYTVPQAPVGASVDAYYVVMHIRSPWH